MPRPPLIERYFAQCQAHRTAPLPAFVTSLTDGVMELNLADISLADIRLFAIAVMDTAPAAAPLPTRERRRGGDGAATIPGDVSSGSSAHGQATTFFSKLHFTYDLSSSSSQRSHTNAARGGGGAVAAAAAAPASPPPLLAPQSEATLRCFIEAVAQLVKENASTLRSFAWGGLPIVAPSRGLFGARVNALSLTQLLPLCHDLTRLHIVGVALSRAQFMQLTMISLSSSTADVSGGSWLELEEASFVNCDLRDTCKSGIVRLIRAGLPMKTAELWRRSLRSSGGSFTEQDAGGPLPATTVAAGTSTMRGLRRLDVSQNPLGDETARALATAIAGSALHTLCLANTAITEKGAAVLLLPAVLEENAVELVDLSNTRVSDAYGTSTTAAASSSAELRLLATSSLAAGFRVVARGMGQLLVLREAVRVAQQPWSVRTPTTTATQPPTQPSRASPPPVLTQPPVMGAAPQPSRGREESEYVTAEDPFGAFINTTPTSFATPAAGRISSPALPRQPQQQQSAAAPIPTRGPAAAAPAPLQASPPPGTAAAAAAGPAATPYGPWWPPMAPWYTVPHPYPTDAAGGPGRANAGAEWVPVPVPVPVPVYVPTLEPPYGNVAIPGGAIPWAGSAFPVTPGATTTTATTTAAAEKTSDNDGGPTAQAAAAFLRESTERLGADTTGGSRPHVKKVEEDSGDDVGEHIEHTATAEEAVVVTPRTNTESLADRAASSSTELTRSASEAAGSSKFLVALISRLEAHETDVSERLEQHYQRTTSQLTALEKDMRFRLQQLAEAERKERTAATERHTEVLEAVAALHEAPVRSAAATMSEEMLSQLVQLIETGMKRVHAVLAKDGEGKIADKKPPVIGPAAGAIGGGGGVASITASTERDMVTETNQRLKQLGW